MLRKTIKLIKLSRRPKLIQIYLTHKVAASVEHSKHLSKLSCAHVIDIGANRGQFALIARSCFPKAKIDSFEPLAEPAFDYKKVFAKDSLSRLHQLAIGDEAITTTIHISNKDHSSSLLPISKKQSELFPGTSEKETRSIEVSPLDKILSRKDIKLPALLKIDVQGLELEVLKGCGLLLDTFDHVYVECSFVELYSGQALSEEIICFLASQNFRLQGVYNMYNDNDGNPIQADFLFVKKQLSE